jgi:hypothetical protein
MTDYADIWGKGGDEADNSDNSKKRPLTASETEENPGELTLVGRKSVSFDQMAEVYNFSTRAPSWGSPLTTGPGGENYYKVATKDEHQGTRNDPRTPDKAPDGFTLLVPRKLKNRILNSTFQLFKKDLAAFLGYEESRHWHGTINLFDIDIKIRYYEIRCQLLSAKLNDTSFITANVDDENVSDEKTDLEDEDGDTKMDFTNSYTPNRSKMRRKADTSELVPGI